MDPILANIPCEHVFSTKKCTKYVIPEFEGNFGLYVANSSFSNSRKEGTLVSTWSFDKRKLENHSN